MCGWRKKQRQIIDLHRRHQGEILRTIDIIEPFRGDKMHHLRYNPRPRRRAAGSGLRTHPVAGAEDIAWFAGSRIDQSVSQHSAHQTLRLRLVQIVSQMDVRHHHMMLDQIVRAGSSLQIAGNQNASGEWYRFCSLKVSRISPCRHSRRSSLWP